MVSNCQKRETLLVHSSRGFSSQKSRRVRADLVIYLFTERCFKMCLGIPAKVIQIDDSGQGKIDYMGTKVRTNFTLLEDVKKGDWVIVHAGFAISKLDEEEARETLELLREFAITTDDKP